MGSRLLFWAFLVLTLACIMTAVGRSQDHSLTTSFSDWLQHPAIQYATKPTTDPIAQLNQKIQSGRVVLKFEGVSGYLRSLLDVLHVPIDSQVAVFARDSVQAARITPRNPRTIFFSDSIAVGWVRGGFIEIASQDPQQGTVFYTLEPIATDKPVFTRTDNCLACHYTYATAGVPGMLVRSAGQYRVDQNIPLEERWGGWYVTGQVGSIRHMGNVEIDKLFDSSRPADTFNLRSFEGKFDTVGYLTTSSDVAALMVFEHQMHMMNLLSRIGWEVRTGEPSVSIQDAAAEVVDYMLFIEEAEIPNRIQGSTNFAEAFAAQGPHDEKGRTLRQLALDRRLMRYPCSYMIYSSQFQSLPAEAKAAIYQRMWRILSGQEKAPGYSRLSAADRLAIVEILKSTKKELPDYFQPAAVR
jgi:hypothetical protein